MKAWLLAILGLITIQALAQPVQENPRAEYRWHQTIPAGPYSVANTATGTLLTTIPLVSVDGPAATKLEFVLTHMSFQYRTPELAYAGGEALAFFWFQGH